MVCEEQGFDTGLRILEIIKILLNKDISKADLIADLKTNSKIENIYSLEAFIKYFNTLEICGLKVRKYKNLYKLENALYQADLTEKERKVFIEIIENIHLLHNEKLEAAAKSALNKIVKYFDSPLNTVSIEKINEEKQNRASMRNEVVELLENMMRNNSQVKIEYKKKNNTTVSEVFEIIEINEKSGKYVVNCRIPNAGRNRKLNLDSIVGITETPRQAANMTYNNSIIFEIYGRLMSLYKLKPSERIINFTDEKMVISNSGEDKDMLLRRLMRYGENCKIIMPEAVRVDFLKLADDILDSLEGK